MSLNQDALVLLAPQSVGGCNLYSYSPDNGDDSTDVLQNEYFSQSRFEGTDGWVNGYILCQLSDGGSIIQIGESAGVQVATLIAGASQNTTILDDIIELFHNVRDYTVINMGAGDFTMSAVAAQYAIWFVVNVGDGTKTLTIPTTSDATRPAQTAVVSLGYTNGFTLECQTGGSSLYINGGTVTNVTTNVSGVISVDYYTNIEARGATNGVNEISGDFSITRSSRGQILEGTGALAQTFTIEPDNVTTNFTCDVYCSGAGGVTITNGVGVTVTGNTVLATGDSCKIARKGSSETYICI